MDCCVKMLNGIQKHVYSIKTNKHNSSTGTLIFYTYGTDSKPVKLPAHNSVLVLMAYEARCTCGNENENT